MTDPISPAPPLDADYLRGYATALIDAIAAIEYARTKGGPDDAAFDGLNAAVFVLRQIRPPRAAAKLQGPAGGARADAIVKSAQSTGTQADPVSPAVRPPLDLWAVYIGDDFLLAFGTERQATDYVRMAPPLSKAFFVRHFRAVAEGGSPSLFQSGTRRLHSGQSAMWKINCDALTDADWHTLAVMAVERLPPFGRVEGVPRGGVRFASALQSYVTSGPMLIVDDVLTTGASMKAHRAGREAIGLVAFGRGVVPPWITPLFTVRAEGGSPSPAEKGQMMTDVLSDPTVIWYGPHACDTCGALVVKVERARGGEAFDVPERLLRVFNRGAESGDPAVAYPMVWTPHVHRTNESDPHRARGAAPEAHSQNTTRAGTLSSPAR